jgi:hypothetical protein
VTRQVVAQEGKGKRMKCNPPNRLYHYTDKKGLFGILDEKKLHATNYHYVDDPTELRYATKRTSKRIKALGLNLKLDMLNPVSLDFIERTEFHISIFSLSTEKDLLSQWRGYCGGGGYAIGFDYQQLDSILRQRGKQHNRLHLRPCIYDKYEHSKVIDSYISDMDSKNMRNIPLNHFSVNIGLSLKDPSFREEHEWRIISDVISPIFNETNKKYGIEWKKKISGYRIVPYMEIDLDDGNGVLPISEIVVGPFGNVKALTKLANDILKRYEIKNCIIKQSHIPH